MANTLAYYDMELITAVKCFIVQALRGQCNKTFYPQFTNVRNKLECLVPVKPLQPNLMFATKAGAYPKRGPDIYTALKGRPKTLD